MSVPKNKRGGSLLEALYEMSNLFQYTMKLCTTEKVMPKKYRWFGGRDVAKSATNALKYGSYANGVRVTGTETALLRRQYQIMMCNELVTLGLLVNEFYKVRRFKKKTFKNWRRSYCKTYALARAWKKSDDDRFKKYRTNEELNKLVMETIIIPALGNVKDLNMDIEYIKSSVCPEPPEDDTLNETPAEIESKTGQPSEEIRFNSKKPKSKKASSSDNT